MLLDSLAQPGTILSTNQDRASFVLVISGLHTTCELVHMTTALLPLRHKFINLGLILGLILQLVP